MKSRFLLLSGSAIIFSLFYKNRKTAEIKQEVKEENFLRRLKQGSARDCAKVLSRQQPFVFNGDDGPGPSKDWEEYQHNQWENCRYSFENDPTFYTPEEKITLPNTIKNYLETANAWKLEECKKEYLSLKEPNKTGYFDSEKEHQRWEQCVKLFTHPFTLNERVTFGKNIEEYKRNSRNP